MSKVNNLSKEELVVGQISVERLTKNFDSEAGNILALDGIDLEVIPQEFITLVGRSGCGKSTLLRCIGGLIPPSTGGIKISGNVVTEPHPQIGYVFQQAVLLPWRTVEENVLLPFVVKGNPTNKEINKVKEVLEIVGLSDYANHRPGELSGGMQQRVSVARALVTEPSILLMDEPFGALDAQTREDMNVELLRIWEVAKTTIVFVTHDIGEALFLSDRVVIMSARPGKIDDIIEVNSPRPRTFDQIENDPEFWKMRRRIREALH